MEPPHRVARYCTTDPPPSIVTRSRGASFSRRLLLFSSSLAIVAVAVPHLHFCTVAIFFHASLLLAPCLRFSPSTFRFTSVLGCSFFFFVHLLPASYSVFHRCFLAANVRTRPRSGSARHPCSDVAAPSAAFTVLATGNLFPVSRVAASYPLPEPRHLALSTAISATVRPLLLIRTLVSTLTDVGKSFRGTGFLQCGGAG